MVPTGKLGNRSSNGTVGQQTFPNILRALRITDIGYYTFVLNIKHSSSVLRRYV